MFKYHCLNPISPVGMGQLDANYENTENAADADVILVRSAKMHEMEFGENLKAIARAGAGVNNIPLDRCAEEGIVVFNTPGANANGVKELVIAGMLLAARDIVGGINWVKGYDEDGDIAKVAEKKKKAFAGTELKGKKLAVVPILRAGLGMVDGMLEMIPAAKVGHIGMYRDPKTAEPVEYYCKLPADCANREVFVVDPMLATGGSAVAALDLLKQKGVKNIHFMCIIAAPEGVKKLTEAHPDVDLYIGALDDHLNEKKYIVPGLGDAGDRIFGTK